MSDIDIAVADGLKVLDLKRPIREADVSSKGLVAFMSTRPGLGLMGFGEASFIAVAILEKPKRDLFRNKRPCPMRWPCIARNWQPATAVKVGRGRRRVAPMPLPIVAMWPPIFSQKRATSS